MLLQPPEFRRPCTGRLVAIADRHRHVRVEAEARDAGARVLPKRPRDRDNGTVREAGRFYTDQRYSSQEPSLDRLTRSWRSRGCLRLQGNSVPGTRFDPDTAPREAANSSVTAAGRTRPPVGR